MTISGQNFTEAALMANMYKLLLENKGYSVTMKLVGSRDVYMAKGQFPGSVDVVPEYLGGIADKLNQMQNGSNAKSITTSDVQGTLDAVKPLADKAGITLLDPAEATDQNAFFVTKKYADSNSLKNLSDLGALGKPVVLAAAPDREGPQRLRRGPAREHDGIKITKVRAARVRLAADRRVGVRTARSQLGETSPRPTPRWARRASSCSQDDKGVQPVQNLVRR